MLSARLRGSLASIPPLLRDQFSPNGRRLLRKAAPTFFALAIGTAAACAQDHGRPANTSPETSPSNALPDHVPSWANDRNYIEAVPSEQPMEPMTLVLARHPDRHQAFEKLLADQQDPVSPDYHRWLTPTEIGERYGLSTRELSALTGWLQSQGLHVDWVAPARNFIGFSGSAGDVGRAFQTRVNRYSADGRPRFSIASAPILPSNLASLVESIHGLYTIENRPMHTMQVMRAAFPQMTLSNGEHLIAPGDFEAIYDLGSDIVSGNSVGIVGRSRTDFNDFENFEGFTGSLSLPVEVVPTKFGGVDPGPAFTFPPSGGESVGDQGEATLDVERIASIATYANTLLVVATQQSGGIGVDAQYLVQTEPVPAQVISISFGACESEAGPTGVKFWNRLFEQAAGEGISVLVASGDSGASGCDAAFSAPPADPEPNSPNYICSSSYATCVGGTEFNDSGDPSRYWNSGYGADPTAIGYIPEGGWNEPGTSSQTQVAASGGGVSRYISTPAWQTGKGVPTARSGRYTPDLAFSASQHDGYFGCFAAGGGACVNQDGYVQFVSFAGTSAAAPDMAGITVQLDNQLGQGQGNLNPRLYAMASRAPSVFHDVTVASSGVGSCSVGTPSMCNNSIAAPSGLSGGQAGYQVGIGFDEVTGLGSLDVRKFLTNYWPAQAPVLTTGPATHITADSAILNGTVNSEGAQIDCWFEYGTNPAKFGYPSTFYVTVHGTTAQPISALAGVGILPKTKYYYRTECLVDDGIVGNLESFTSARGTQTIVFEQHVTSFRYGASPVTLRATSSSRLPVDFRVIKGPGKIDHATHQLLIEGAGEIVVEAIQPGNDAYFAAEPVKHTWLVKKASLTVSAANETMKRGAAVPQLRFLMTGFVNGDTRYTATRNDPALSTSATPQSPAGKYPIDISAGRLTSANYDLQFVNGWMTVTP